MDQIRKIPYRERSKYFTQDIVDAIKQNFVFHTMDSTKLYNEAKKVFNKLITDEKDFLLDDLKDKKINTDSYYSIIMNDKDNSLKSLDTIKSMVTDEDTLKTLFTEFNTLASNAENKHINECKIIYENEKLPEIYNVILSKKSKFAIVNKISPFFKVSGERKIHQTLPDSKKIPQKDLESLYKLIYDAWYADIYDQFSKIKDQKSKEDILQSQPDYLLNTDKTDLNDLGIINSMLYKFIDLENLSNKVLETQTKDEAKLVELNQQDARDPIAIYKSIVTTYIKLKIKNLTEFDTFLLSDEKYNFLIKDNKFTSNLLSSDVNKIIKEKGEYYVKSSLLEAEKKIFEIKASESATKVLYDEISQFYLDFIHNDANIKNQFLAKLTPENRLDIYKTKPPTISFHKKLSIEGAKNELLNELSNITKQYVYKSIVKEFMSYPVSYRKYIISSLKTKDNTYNDIFETKIALKDSLPNSYLSKDLNFLKALDSDIKKYLNERIESIYNLLLDVLNKHMEPSMFDDHYANIVFSIKKKNINKFIDSDDERKVVDKFPVDYTYKELNKLYNIIRPQFYSSIKNKFDVLESNVRKNVLNKLQTANEDLANIFKKNEDELNKYNIKKMTIDSLIKLSNFIKEESLPEKLKPKDEPKPKN